MPPKNMISVTRNSHMPKVEVAFCCSRSAKWCFRFGLCWTCSTATWLSGNFNPLRWRRVDLVVVVGFPGHHRRLVEVKCRRRRRSHPLESRGAVGVRPRIRTILQAPDQVDHRQQEAHCKNGCAGRGQHIQHLELGRVLMIAARHAHVAKKELREEG